MSESSLLEDVTGMMLAWQQSDEALERLIPSGVSGMRRVARASERLRSEPPGHILQTTALVHSPKREGRRT